MIADLVSARYAVSAPSLAVFGVSIALCVILIIVYCRMHNRRKWDQKVEGRHGKATSPRHAPTPRSSTLNIQGQTDSKQEALLPGHRGSVITDYRGTAAPKKVRREHPSATHDDWGDTVQSFGIDLGSFSIKSHFMAKDQKLVELPPKRALCTLLEEGVSFGDVEIALESAGTSLFSLTRDLCDPDSTVSYGDVSMRPYQAVAGVFQAIIGERQLMPPVAVCIPPYLQQVAQHLYLSAVAANLNRFFIFHHSAALIAALLRHRQQAKQKTKPPRNVVFVDLGRSGVAAYVAEVRDLSGSVRFQSFRCAGIQNMEARLVLELSSALDEKDSTTMARVIEAAREIREDYASVPEYLIQSRKKSSVAIPTSNGDVVLELGREVFDQICELATADLEEVMEEVTQHLASGGVTVPGEPTELVLLGKAFNHKPFRNIFEQRFDRKLSSLDKISVSQGLAVLGVMENPKYTGQRYDVYPLFQLPTVDEMGTRKFQDSQRGLVSAQKNSSQLHNRENSRVSASTLARE